MPERIQFVESADDDMYYVYAENKRKDGTVNDAYIGLVVLPWWELLDPSDYVEIHSWALEMPDTRVQIAEVDSFCEWLARLYFHFYRR